MGRGYYTEDRPPEEGPPLSRKELKRLLANWRAMMVLQYAHGADAAAARDRLLIDAGALKLERLMGVR